MGVKYLVERFHGFADTRTEPVARFDTEEEAHYWCERFEEDNRNPRVFYAVDEIEEEGAA